jgi:acetoin utilization deacetylase AcuC-like enzyme
MIRDVQLMPEWEGILQRLAERYEQSSSVGCNACGRVLKRSNLLDSKCDGCNIQCTTAFISPIEGDLTFACPTSTACLRALLASTAWLLMRQQVNKIQRVMLLSHPPGHHSDNDTPQNFCLLNTAVCAAEFLLKRMHLNRVVILDWDVHHGNGTQKLTYERDDILFVDIHRDDFYPFTGKAAENGIGRGAGFTLNLPLPAGSGEATYRPAMAVAISRIRDFNAQWILVSCGLNAHERDPIGGMKLAAHNYREFSEMVHALNLPTTYLLEGGNDADVLTECIAAMVRVD